MMNKAILEGLSKGMNYEDYQNLIDTLLAENKTTGPNQSEALYRIIPK